MSVLASNGEELFKRQQAVIISILLVVIGVRLGHLLIHWVIYKSKVT